MALQTGSPKDVKSPLTNLFDVRLTLYINLRDWPRRKTSARFYALRTSMKYISALIQDHISTVDVVTDASLENAAK